MNPPVNRTSLFRRIGAHLDERGIFFALRAFPSTVHSDFRDLDVAIFAKDRPAILEVVRRTVREANGCILREVRGISTLSVVILFEEDGKHDILSMDLIDPVMCNRWFLPRALANRDLRTRRESDGLVYIALSDQVALRAIKNLSEGESQCRRLFDAYRNEAAGGDPLDRDRVAALIGRYIGESRAVDLCDILEDAGGASRLGGWYRESKAALGRYLAAHPWEAGMHVLRKLGFSLHRFCQPTEVVRVPRTGIEDERFREEVAFVGSFMKSTVVLDGKLSLPAKIWRLFEARRNWGVVFVASDAKSGSTSVDRSPLHLLYEQVRRKNNN